MEQEYEFHEILEKTLLDIDNYCQSSFRIKPDKCMPFIMSFIQHMDQLVLGLAPKQVKKVKNMLSATLEALQKRDYVLVRDCLTYELKPLLLKVKCNIK